VPEGLGRINFDDLQGEVASVCEKGNHYAGLAAQARKQAKIAEIDCDVLEKQKGKTARLAAVARGEKFTVDSIKDEVGTDPVVIEWKKKVVELEYQAEVLDAAKFAYIHKAQLLQGVTGIVTEEIRARRFGGALPGEGKPLPFTPVSGAPRRVPRTPV